MAVKAFRSACIILMMACALPEAPASVAAADVPSPVWKYATYAQYQETHASAPAGAGRIALTAADLIGRSGGTSLLGGIAGRRGEFISVPEQSVLSFGFSLPAAGLYALQLTYYLPEGAGAAARCRIELDGALPFREAADVQFPRIFVYKDHKPYSLLDDGSQIKNEIVERLGWQTRPVRDSAGICAEPLQLYLSAGEHTLAIASNTEPMIIGAAELYPYKAPVKYAEYYSSKVREHGKPAKHGQSVGITIEAETIGDRTSSSIYGSYDFSSPSTSPCSAGKSVINYLSGSVSKAPGDAVSYNFSVKEAGWYKLSFKYRQTYRPGGFVSRRVYIDGEIPFMEADALRFGYSRDWDNIYLGGDDDSCLIWLAEGGHTLSLEGTAGSLAPVISRCQTIIDSLNRIYRSLFILTGPSPDPFRDYNFGETAKEELAALKKLSGEIEDIISDITALTGQTGSFISAPRQLNVTIRNMLRSPDSIAGRLNSFVSNLGSLSEWVIALREQPLDLDLFELTPPGVEPSFAGAGFFAGVLHQLRLFLNSFARDYGAGAAPGERPAIKVWLGETGRDQANIVRQLISEGFTRESGIPVKLQFATGALLPSTLAGIGPDVFLFAPSAEPINYALRGAVEPLDRFEGFADVRARLSKQAMVPYSYMGRVYAIPETEQFPMLFYRLDILDELEISVPQTWDDVYNALSKLQGQNLSAGMLFDFTAYYMFLSQRGIPVYKESGAAVGFDGKTGVSAFTQWTEFFTNYKLSTAYSFVNRFRTGEMALGIADFSFANQLYVSAPEIRGMWHMAPLPGTASSSGEINRSAPITSTANIMLRQSGRKAEGWEFLRWWSSSGNQARYAAQLEQSLGIAARYPTANLEAFARQDWPAEDAAALREQRKSLVGIPEVPGSYITSRYINFAFSEVVDEGGEPGKALLDYAGKINLELKRKRKEFARATD